MSNGDYEIDLEMLADFIDESLDSLGAIPGLFIELEEHPTNLKLIESIFRPVHSLKGNAAYFGLMRTKSLAHDLESILDDLRKSRLVPTKEIIDGLLAGVDELIKILEATRVNGQETIDDSNFEKVLQAVRELGHAEVTAPPVIELPPAKIAPAETGKTIEQILEILERVRQSPKLAGSDEAKQLETAIGLLGKLGLSATGTHAGDSILSSELDLVSQLEEVLLNQDLSDDDRAKLLTTILGELCATIQHERTRELVTKAREDCLVFLDTIGFDPLLVETLQEMIVNIRTMLKESASAFVARVEETKPPAEPKPEQQLADEPAVPVTAATPAIQEEKQEVKALPSDDASLAEVKAVPKLSKPESKEVGRTMRVSEDAIDSFLGYVGELISVDEMFRYIHSRMVEQEADLTITSSLLRVINTFTKLSDDLQQSIMEIRRIPVKPMLQKTQRIVRDVAHSNHKKIEVRLSGVDLHIDRSLIETLEAPLVHMVRNAADHGIEVPGNRLAQGKSETGSIEISMDELDDEIYLTVHDDGAGLDLDKISKKAIKMGLIAEGSQMNQDALIECIFASGMSTAEKITDVSGRGVGMDAVRASVLMAGGDISVETEPGMGTTFQIKIPSSVGTQIINSFVVLIGEQRYILPMDKVSGSFRPGLNDFVRLPNGYLRVRRKENILPVSDLNGAYKGEVEPLTKGILIRIDSQINPFTFFVDKILGLQKVVLRRIPWLKFDKYQGAAVMGDGRVSLILSMEHFHKINEDMPPKRVAS